MEEGSRRGEPTAGIGIDVHKGIHAAAQRRDKEKIRF